MYPNKLKSLFELKDVDFYIKYGFSLPMLAEIEI